jgi:hypothetical protein
VAVQFAAVDFWGKIRLIGKERFKQCLGRAGGVVGSYREQHCGSTPRRDLLWRIRCRVWVLIKRALQVFFGEDYQRMFVL